MSSEKDSDATITVLIVDDNKDSRELLVKLLSMKNYETIEAEDGEEAFKKAVSMNPDIILMDQSLPGMNGYEVTRKLRHTDGFQTIPIVALTAHAMRGEKEKALGAGCTGYIAKPIDVRTFPDVIESYVNHGKEEYHSHSG